MMSDEDLQRLADRAAIQDCLYRYARGVDRGDWDLVRSTYHPDAWDEHGDYRGGMDGFVAWLDKRLAGVDNSMHLLSNCLIEFAAPDFAFVETYFVSRRLTPPNASQRAEFPAGAALCREVAGRYADHFERRDGQWRVLRRIVVVEASSSSVALGGERNPAAALTWGRRDRDDPSYISREALFAKAASSAR
jgi:SnoaL-like domain